MGTHRRPSPSALDAARRLARPERSDQDHGYASLVTAVSRDDEDDGNLDAQLLEEAKSVKVVRVDVFEQ
jgi:hypothetical protein